MPPITASSITWDIARAGGKLRQVAGRNKGLKTIAHNRGQVLNLEVKGPGWYANNNRPLVRLRNAAVAAGALKRVFFSNDTTYRILTALHQSAEVLLECVAVAPG